MTEKWLYMVLITIYLAVVGINLFVSLKFPDITIKAVHFTASFILFVIVLIGVTKSLRYLKGILLVGAVSSIFVAFTHLFNDFLLNHWILDMIAGLQYPLYILFITPLFGVNIFIKGLSGTFALYCIVIFISLYVLAKIVTWRTKAKLIESNL